MSGSWPVVRLGEVLERRQEVADFDPESSYREITVRLWGKGVTLRGVVAGSELAGSRRFVARTGDLIISKIDARNGAIGLVPAHLDGGVVTQDFPLFAHDHERLEPDYLAWMAKTSDFVQLCLKSSEGSTNRVRLKEDRFMGMELPLPPLDEQRRIVSRIEEVATRVEAVRRLKSEATQGLDDACIAMAHRLDLSDLEKKRNGWHLCRFGELVDAYEDAVRVDATKQYPNFGIYSYARGLFAKPSIDGALTSASTLFRAKSGLFIYSRLFAFEGSYGIVDDEFEGSLVSNEYPMFQPKENVCNAQFLLAHFMAPSVWSRVAEGSRGLGDRRQRVQPTQLNAYSLWVPPLDVQARLSSLMKLRKTSAALENSAVHDLDALLPSILDRAFRGEL